MDVITVVTPSNVKKVKSNHESADVKNNGDVVEPKTVRKNSFRPLVIEDWNFDDDSEVEFIPNVKDKIVRPSTEKIKFIKVKDTTARDRAVVSENKEKGVNAVKASACWGNPQQKEYKEKGVIDSGCSRHMTGNKCYLTEYEDYDGGFFFGFPLEMVLFLATKDETSRILKTFITEIENQLDYKVKVIRSDNRTEFKNSVMNQFCEMKGIKREFSVSRTPQQNSIAERRNRTLIEAARTMLVDSKLPTTFWAEAVNTCYVLNRVLVIKPHTKTPYELIHGRTPLIDFMKSFGCPVTILNTRDHLGKFNGKADE
ncbi:ribonuclease H-like domain-containing protein [Tanacetum coccineum]